MPPGVRPDTLDGATYVGLDPVPDGRRRASAARPGRAVGGHVPGDQRAAVLRRRDRPARHRVPQPRHRPRGRGGRRARGVRAALPLGADAVRRAGGTCTPTTPACAGRGRTATSHVVVRVGGPARRRTPLDDFRRRPVGSARALVGPDLYVPNTHEPWPLHDAEVLELDDGLIGVGRARRAGRPRARPRGVQRRRAHRVRLPRRRPPPALSHPGTRQAFGSPHAPDRLVSNPRRFPAWRPSPLDRPTARRALCVGALPIRADPGGTHVPSITRAGPDGRHHHCRLRPRARSGRLLAEQSRRRQCRRQLVQAVRDRPGHHAHRRSVRHVRLQGERALRRVQEGLPEHHDQGRRRRAVGGLLDAAEDPARLGQRPRRRPGDRDRLRRRRRAEPRRPVRELQRRARTPARIKAHVLPLEVGAGHAPRTARPPSGSAPTPARRRSATAPTCSSRPACRPTRRRSATKWSTWEDFIDFGKQYEASTTKPSGSHFVDSAASIFSTAVYQGNEAYDNADGKPDVENSDGVKTAWKLRDPGRAGRASPPGSQQFSDAVEQGVLQRRVRGDRLPHLDDGLHPGPGR